MLTEEYVEPHPADDDEFALRAVRRDGNVLWYAPWGRYDPPQPDEPDDDGTEQAVDFLTTWHGDDPITIVTIDPADGKTKRYDFTDQALLRQCIAQTNGHRNIYTQVNACLHGATKPSKAQMTAARAVWVDADFHDMGIGREAAIERARQLEPSIINFSGNGLWALWLLDAPYDDEGWQARIEAASGALHRRLGANDACRNVDRLMRVPGTVNLPNAAKLARGCVAVDAYTVEADWSRRFSIDHFDAPVERYAEGRAASGNVARRIPDRFARELRKELPEGERSEFVFSVCCKLVRWGWNDDEIVGVLMDERHPALSGHCAAQQGIETAKRQVARARETIAADWARNVFGQIAAASTRNLEKALGEMSVSLSFNEFADRVLVEQNGRVARFDDDLGNDLRFAIEKQFGFEPPKDKFFDYARSLARANAFHPVKDYLDGLRWDGEPRLEGWLTKYASAQDTPLIRAFARTVLVAAVRRIWRPGSEFHEMLILMDRQQGTGKSSLIKSLVPDRSWFSDGISLGMGQRELLEMLQGKWIIEVAELTGMGDKRIGHIRAMLSRDSDRARAAYARLVREVDRYCVFMGTTNAEFPLADAQNRRFWPVRTGAIDIDGLVAMRDQLWAEAMVVERRGDSIRLDASLWADAAALTEAHRAMSGWEERLIDVFGEFSGGKIPVVEIWRVLGIPTERQSTQRTAERDEIMGRLGWERKTAKHGNRATKCFVKGDGPDLYVDVDALGRAWVTDQGPPDFGEDAQFRF